MLCRTRWATAPTWPKQGPAPQAYNRQRDESGEVMYAKVEVQAISGIAPQCKLLSLKVMDDDGEGGSQGEVSNLIAAIAMIQELNGYGRKLIVHGVNMSVGYEFDPKWFACGQSPLCVEINRLVRSGVSVVVVAGNTGYGASQSRFNGIVSAGMSLTINDPGNADLAITVGSTHRDTPHVYGVSYLLVEGPHRRRPRQTRPGGAGRENSVVRHWRLAPEPTPRRTKQQLRGRQRHQHGGPPRVGSHCRLSLHPPRIHRRA